MKVLVLGGDGYLGWPTAMHLAARGHNVCCVDNYLRRRIAEDTDSQPLFDAPMLDARAEIFHRHTGVRIEVKVLDCTDFEGLSGIFNGFAPDAVVHYAEQPSGPYSMIAREQARLTLDNNLRVTFNVIWAVLECAPESHIVKLGTMGEYGTPNIDIEEGWLNVTHNGREQRFLYPRQAGSLYHTTKILDTDLLWFYVRHYGLRVTDLMQGPVYGLSTPECDLDTELLPHFHYDDIFGTVLNRFLVQAVAGVPLTVYGAGGQERGFLNLLDTLQCVELALMHSADPGELRVLNQFTEQFSVSELARRVQRAGARLGLDVAIESIPNPREEREQHYYHAAHTGLLELGLEPHLLTDEVLVEMLGRVCAAKAQINPERIMPRVRWPGR